MLHGLLPSFKDYLLIIMALNLCFLLLEMEEILDII